MRKDHSYEDKKVVEGQIKSNVSTQGENPAKSIVALVVCNILNGGLAQMEYMPGIPASRQVVSPRNFRAKSHGKS